MKNAPFPIHPITKENPFKIVFVCLGNICRSPTGEGVMQHIVNEEGLQAYFEIDSAGTSAYHIGEPANSKSQSTANKHGVELHSKARRFGRFDLDYFDLILPMDFDNYENIIDLCSTDEQRKKVYLLRYFDPETEEPESVPDPYYGGMQGFENVFQMVKRSSQFLLDELKSHIKE